MCSYLIVVGCNLCRKLSSSVGRKRIYISGWAIFVLWVALKLIESNRWDWVVAVLYTQPQLICSHCGTGLSNHRIYFSLRDGPLQKIWDCFNGLFKRLVCVEAGANMAQKLFSFQVGKDVSESLQQAMSKIGLNMRVAAIVSTLQFPLKLFCGLNVLLLSVK